MYINGHYLRHLGIRFPESPAEACANIKKKLTTATRISQLIMSVGIGVLGLSLEKMGCFTEHPVASDLLTPVSTSLTFPFVSRAIGNATDFMENSTSFATLASVVTGNTTDLTEGNTTSTLLTTLASMVTGNTTDLIEGNTTSTLLTTLASMVTGNRTDLIEGNTTSTLLTTLASMVTGNVADGMNAHDESSMLIVPGETAFWKDQGGGETDYCLPLSGFVCMYSGVVCVWTLVKVIKRCRKIQQVEEVAALVTGADIILLGASGSSLASHLLLPTCYPGIEGPYNQVCSVLDPMVVASSVLYFAHAGLLVVSAVCKQSHRKRQWWVRRSMEDLMQQVGIPFFRRDRPPAGGVDQNSLLVINETNLSTSLGQSLGMVDMGPFLDLPALEEV
ncbi:hypothetical protein CLAVI_000264 [Candidatus Clavichlamydia salmonicola]|nr:hypothetical protein [Candidatus Clavichlamydia salmonicola]